MVRVREIVCEYQPIIPVAPMAPAAMFQKAASNDGTTIEAFADLWLDNIRANKKRFGDFGQKGIGNLFGKYLHRPVILAGAGPSLKFNGDLLKDRKGLPLISCLHNYHFFRDRGVPVDYWVTLDAGAITIPEVSEGGQGSEEDYWESTKDQTLLAFIGTHPELLEKWQGQIYFYNATVPDKKYRDALEEIEPFHQWVGSGGNVLGAALYIAKAWFGSPISIFVGADFSFGYDRKFHPWDSSYDKKIGACIPAVDVFGHTVATWPSYNNFKSYFDWLAQTVPGIYINATEGGTMGSYRDGNIAAIRQMDLKDVINLFSIHEVIKPSAMDPKVDGDPGRTILY